MPSTFALCLSWQPENVLNLTVQNFHSSGYVQWYVLLRCSFHFSLFCVIIFEYLLRRTLTYFYVELKGVKKPFLVT